MSRLFILLALVCATSASAQQVVVSTTAESAVGTPARTSLQIIDFERQDPVRPATVLPGSAPLAPLAAAPLTAAPLAAAPLTAAPVTASQKPGAGACLTATYRQAYASFFDATGLAASTLRFADDYRPADACMAAGRAGEVLVVASRSVDETAIWPGAVQGFQIERPSYSTSEASVFQILLHGACAALAPIPPGDRVAVLCRGKFECTVSVALIDTLRGELAGELENLAADTELLSVAPGAIAASRDGSNLFVLVTGYGLNQRSGEAVSWLYNLDPVTLEKRGEPLQIEGVAGPADRPLQPAGEDLCWVATRPRGSDFAYATLIRATQGGVEKVTQIPYSGVGSSFRIEPQPDGARAAIAVDECVQIRDEQGVTKAEWSFRTPVRALCWASENLFAADAGRVHLLKPADPDSVLTVQLQSGQVQDMVETVSTVEPMTQPLVQLPQSISFRGQAVGQEVKALVIEPREPGASWQVQYDRDKMPWLVIHPTVGTGNGVVYMGVDPAGHRPGAVEQGLLAIHAATTLRDVAEAQGKVVEVAVLPEARSEVRRILWAWGDESAGSLRAAGDARSLQRLADMLAGPPHFFTHQELAGTPDESLASYAIVVISAQAAARGMVSRQSVLEYVARGGAVLFLGEHLQKDGERDLAQWLAPMGIRLDVTTPVAGSFSATDSHWLTRHWPQGRLEGGCAMYADQSEDVLVPGPASEQQNPGVLIARTYGRGRIASLAAATPLQSDALEKQDASLFATDLFEWLAGANEYLENQDMDSDGLADSLEDANANGVVDNGETDFLKADSDNDGLPDGIEDANLNGKCDEGETDPLNADSDGDGVQDGADETPVASVDAPTLEGVSPSEGPAEGGSLVVISGRNLPSDAALWFGDRPSPSVRIVDANELVAETPAFSDKEGGAVAVTLKSASAQVETSLASAFTYLRRSPLRVVLRALDHIEKVGEMYQGTLQAQLEKTENALVSNVTLVLAPAPAGMKWLSPKASGKSTPVMRQLKSGELLLTVLHAETAAASSSLVTIPWEGASLPQVQVKNCQAYTPNGQLLQVDSSALDLTAAWLAQPRPSQQGLAQPR